MTVWTHVDDHETKLSILPSGTEVEIDIEHDSGSLTAALSPKHACTAATALVRSAALANGRNEPVSVFLSRSEWDELLTAATVGANEDPGVRSANRLIDSIRHMLDLPLHLPPSVDRSS